MTKVAFHTLGCKLNFAETSTIARQFNDNGFTRVSFDTVADVYVINTCSVTENADKECKKIVQQVMKLAPEAFVCIVGCYAQLKPDEIAKINGVDLVLGATEKFRIIEYINDLNKKQFAEIHSCEIEDANIFTSAYSIGDRTRAFLKIQDGCDYSCTYCTIPLARGISRSDSLNNVLDNAAQIAKKGIKEIVLTGVNIGDYGKGENGDKKHQHTFLDLVKALDSIDGIERYRISSIEPNLLKNEIIEFVAHSNKFVPHFHIPLQSGCNKILKLMKRRYMRELYNERVSTIKKLIPECCIGVDVITGFPGETEEDFLETYHFLNDLDVSYFHVFTYSERENTEAATFSNVVSLAERKRRTKMLRILSSKKKTNFYNSFKNSSHEVLFESEQKNNRIYGYSRNYLRVSVPFDANLINQKRMVHINKIDGEGNLIATLENIEANSIVNY
ncbi:MAG TPA: tRNA (N(6)-L-threonylcarbamoyladenosine(37)-C(2))-methylthiotransferase MtaB [Bacteroidia bacterium]|nr:tRNA (N(6)-L-threonylcarbamoyladenosine(37)-C(2))-methylthiotransferase MtaB [Bacteroidia bacterium]